MAERYRFTAEDARRGAESTNLALAEKRAEMRARSLVVHEVVSELDDVAPATLRAVLAIAQTVEQNGDLPLDSWLDVQRAATAAEILHRISRLASGQSTSNVAHANLSSEERAERLAQLDAMRAATPDAPAE